MSAGVSKVEAWTVAVGTAAIPSALGGAIWGPWGLAGGAALGLVGLLAWALSGRDAPRRRWARFVLRSKTPPRDARCECCARGFAPLEPAFSCVESGSYVHDACRARHRHPELASVA